MPIFNVIQSFMHFQRSGLACAIWTENAKNFTRFDEQRDAVNGEKGIVFVVGKLVSFRENLDFDNWHIRPALDLCFGNQLVNQGNELCINGCYSTHYHSLNWWRRGELNSRPSARGLQIYMFSIVY